MGCCLAGCLRLLFFQLWKLALAAVLALILARVDAYVEEHHAEHPAGRAWRAYRRRGKKNAQP